MRILVVGAGGIGGYYGGRMLEAGGDVTFLVRPRRAAKLKADGLPIRSAAGDVDLEAPSAVTAEELKGRRDSFDLIILTCKAYDLPGVMDDVSPAVGPGTLVLPTLNGMRHLDALDARFGPEKILGGFCLISVRLDDAGRIAHLSDAHRLVFGARRPDQAGAVQAFAKALEGVKFEAVASDDVILAMWEKWVFLATLAGVTCLTRATIGDVVHAGGTELILAMLEECRAIAEAHGQPPRESILESFRKRLTDPNSTLTASMLDDLQRGGPTEADHILTDLLRRGESAGIKAPLLRAAAVSLRAQEIRAGR